MSWPDAVVILGFFIFVGWMFWLGVHYFHDR